MTNSHTNEADHNTRSFKIKIWNDELLTKVKLYNRSPDLYKDNKCIKCGQAETTLCPFICTDQMEKTRNLIIKTFEQNISTKMTKKPYTSISQQLYNKISLQYNIPILQIIRGVVYKNLTKVINQLI